ncbi:hypothetical protein SDC9_150526 [bioreactor metagenome]|uniref:Uncharacterized protein n=1 Tax=bioreactor metagenome TaxID=1076179 RepID=A0A645EQ68_9ZZZZ
MQRLVRANAHQERRGHVFGQPLIERRHELLELHAMAIERKAGRITDHRRMRRQGTHPIGLAARLPGTPIRLLQTGRIAQVDRQAHPPCLHLRVGQHLRHVRNGGLKLRLQIDKQHVHLWPVQFVGYFQRQMQ